MKKITILFALIAASIYGLKAQTNTPPLPNGNTKIGEHLTVGNSNEIWSDASNLYFNYRGNAVATHFWNKNGSTGASVLSILNTGKVGVGITTPLVPLQINAGSYTDNMALGTATGGFSLTGANGLYGLFSGVSSDGHVWMQVGRNDGLTNTYPLTLQTQGGNVGIGTNSPTVKLTVQSQSTEIAKFSGINNYNYGTFKIIGGTASTPYWRGIFIGANIKMNSTYPEIETSGFRAAAIGFGTDSGEGHIGFFTTSSTALGSILSENMRIMPNGNVGIGTTSPVKSLQIKKNVPNGVGASLMLQNENYSTNNGAETEIILSHLTDNGNPYRYAKIHTVGADAYGTVDRLSFGIATSSSNYSDILTLKSTGNVGIGTTSPQYKLSVKGTIGCGEVKVEDVSSWPDFVFHPTYKLRTLGEVEQFIKANNHLPEIPTESEVKQNGIGLGEMNAKLLQKIEELTLYMIEQNNKMDQQQKQINELKELNNVLVKEVQNIKK